MTRQHFEKIAASIKTARPNRHDGVPAFDSDVIFDAAIDRVATHLAVQFGAANPRFNTALFLKACGCA